MLDSILTSGLTLPTFLICTAASLILGLLTALVCMYRQRCSRGFAVTLAILPAMVQMVILLVNGNIGAGVAVAGAFSLVRFRSVPGTAVRSGPSSWPWPSALPQVWAMWRWRPSSSSSWRRRCWR